MKKLLFILFAMFSVASLSYSQVTWGSLGKIRWDMLDVEVSDSIDTRVANAITDTAKAVVEDSLDVIRDTLLVEDDWYVIGGGSMHLEPTEHIYLYGDVYIGDGDPATTMRSSSALTIETAGGDITLDPAGSDVVVDGNVAPASHDARNLGSDAAHWSNTYISGVLKSDDALTISTEAGGITIDPNDGVITVDGIIVPNATESRDLGTDNLHWRDLYIEDRIKATGALNIITEAGDIGIDPFGEDVVVDGNLSPATHDTRDIGSDASHWKRAYISDSLKSNNALVVNTESGILLLDPADEIRTTTDFRAGTGSSYDLGADDASWDSLFVDDVEIGANLNIGGILTVDSLAFEYTLADTIAAADDLVLDPAGGDVKVDGNVNPSTDNTKTLGTSTVGWLSGYIHNVTCPSGDDLILNTLGGDVNIIATGDIELTAGVGQPIILADSTSIQANATITGDLDIGGALSKGSGTFKIPHPSPEKSGTHTLWHSFVESPTAGDNLYRYRIELKKESLGTYMGTIQLPEYWHDLNKNPQVWVSPVKMLAICTGWLAGNKIVIAGGKPGIYNVLLMGTRKDPIAVENWKGVEREK